MGCICSKGTEDDQQAEAPPPDKSASVKPSAVAPSRREDDPNAKKAPAPVVIDAQLSSRFGAHQRRATVDLAAGGAHAGKFAVSHLPNSLEAEHVAAGWPSWLASVAGEAIKGWLPRRSDSFEKLDKIGQGTYSNVYRAKDLETGKIVALKKVRFVNADPESVRFMAREIRILRTLDHPNVIKLEGLITSRMSGSLYLVFEYMEHDLAGLAATPGIKFTEPQVKCYIQQLLRGLEHCHSRGVLHRDIKGSNLLLDNNGILRIADFGLATFFKPDQKQPLTSRVVTLWYRPPELLLGATEYGVSVDLWSSGCILAELLAGKPIMPGRTEVEQMHKIYKLCGSPSEEYWKKSKLPHATIFRPQQQYKRCVREEFKDFPSTALDLLDVLLSVKPEDRGTATSALKSEFFTTKPFACDPSSLPKYPPSKEFDAKLRNEAKRQKTTTVKTRGYESVRNGPSESQRITRQDVISKFEEALQKRQERPNLNVATQNGLSHSSSMLHPRALGPSWISKVKDDEHGSNHISSVLNSSELKAQKVPPPDDNGEELPGNKRSDNPQDKRKQGHLPDSRSTQLDVVEASEMQEWSQQTVERPASSHKKTERVGGKDANSAVFSTRKNRLHYSGPLVPPGGNLEEMLKEHERQIQQAVRKARLDKSKTKHDHRT